MEASGPELSSLDHEEQRQVVRYWDELALLLGGQADPHEA